MSLRSYQEQAAYEDELHARTPEERAADEAAWKLTKEQVRDIEPCFLHVAKVGVFCMKHAGAYYVCKPRRMRAGRKIAGLK